MKKIFYSLLCIIGLSACSSENVVLDSLRVYDVANSTCKSSLSLTETRPDFYLENDAVPATLSIELGKDGIAQCVLEDVKANCAVRNIYVNIANQDNQITLVVYHNVLDALADCICKYDVNFKMSKVIPGNYQLKVYYAKPNMKYEASDIAYNGQVNLVQNKKAYITLNADKVLPESTPIIQGAKTELFAVGTTRITRAAAKPYLFTLENINSFNVQTREIVFQDFEPTSQLFPIYRNIEVHSYGKVLLHITTFVSSLNSQIFTDLSLVSESGKFYLSDCYPRNIENDSHYAKDNKAIAESREKRATEWGEFLSILRKHGKLIE